MSKVLVVGEDATSVAGRTAVRAALADAGCGEIEAVSFDSAITHMSAGGCGIDLVIVHLSEAEVGRLHRLIRADRDPPVLAICDERYIEAAQLAGVSQCAIRPLRRGELLGRIRWTLRERAELRSRRQRERTKSDKIIALRREKEDLERLACIDSLTGVANRRHALTLLEREWRRAIRERLLLGLVMIDLDCYHAYNEQYGHLAGDHCLQRVCEAMGNCLHRSSDYLGRYGGEEFIAVLPSTDADGAELVAERLRAAVENLGIPHSASRCAEVVTITAGFASLRASSDLVVDRLIEAADAALLRGKAKGRNRVEGDAPHINVPRVNIPRTMTKPQFRLAPILADPWFVTRIPALFSDVHEAARAIMQTLGYDGAAATITASAEPLRARAAELGLARVEQLLAELQRVALTGDVRAAREAADVLIHYITNVQVIYRRPTTPTPSAP